MKAKRVCGFVMAIEKDGTVKVRVKHPGHELNGRKLTAREVRSDIVLDSGDDVHFLVQQTNRHGEDTPRYYAIDVAQVTKDGERQGLSQTVDQNSRLGIAGIITRAGEVYYDLFSFSTRKELEQWLDDAGGDERVLFYVRVTSHDIELAGAEDAISFEEPTAAFTALTALLKLDSARFVFNHVISQVAEAVLKTGKQRVPAPPIVLAIDDRPEEIRHLFTRTRELGGEFQEHIHVFKDLDTVIKDVFRFFPDIILIGHGLSAFPVTGTDVVRALREHSYFFEGRVIAGNSGGGKSVWVRDGIDLAYHVNRDPDKLVQVLKALKRNQL